MTPLAILTAIILFTTLFFLNPSFQELILAALVDQEETIYAQGYTEAAWSKISPGDTMNHVLNTLGPPISKFHNKETNETTFQYTTQGPQNTNYRIRTLIFTANQKVHKKISLFYLD